MKSILFFILGIFFGIICFGYALATIGYIISLDLWSALWNGVIAYLFYIIAGKCF